MATIMSIDEFSSTMCFKIMFIDQSIIILEEEKKRKTPAIIDDYLRKDLVSNSIKQSIA